MGEKQQRMLNSSTLKRKAVNLYENVGSRQVDIALMI
jgi:hypothetical protein